MPTDATPPTQTKYGCGLQKKLFPTVGGSSQLQNKLLSPQLMILSAASHLLNPLCHPAQLLIKPLAVAPKLEPRRLPNEASSLTRR